MKKTGEYVKKRFLTEMIPEQIQIQKKAKSKTNQKKEKDTKSET